ERDQGDALTWPKTWTRIGEPDATGGLRRNPKSPAGRRRHVVLDATRRSAQCFEHFESESFDPLGHFGTRGGGTRLLERERHHQCVRESTLRNGSERFRHDAVERGGDSGYLR